MKILVIALMFIEVLFPQDNKEAKAFVMQNSQTENLDEKSAEQVLLKNIAEKLEWLENQRERLGEVDWKQELENYKDSEAERRQEDRLYFQSKLAEFEATASEQSYDVEKQAMLRQDSVRLQAINEEIQNLKSFLGTTDLTDSASTIAQSSVQRKLSEKASLDSQIAEKLAMLDQVQNDLDSQAHSGGASKSRTVFAQEYGVLTTDGQMMTGELISLNKEGIKLKSKYGVIDVKTDSIMMITYPSFKNQLENIFGIDNLFSNEEKEIEDEIHQLEKDLESLQSSMNPSKIIPEKEIKEKEPRVKFIPYDDPPVPLKAIRPTYPKVAKEKGIEGTVVVQVFVNEKGRVTETAILRGTPDSGLDEAAIKAIEKVKFRPARQGNKKVGVWISIPVNFRLPRGGFW
ncbi:MAG: TonB family protein [Candidatus Marinimicrobia bacterium]|nr:TonB family protein [Candidatus Neomarinimicrobiota bacterium]MBL7031426.1 TonB family protein [Candidatus Neomarinimicrobiota bacterium]